MKVDPTVDKQLEIPEVSSHTSLVPQSPLWRKSAVIGAAGKMGRGIALILLLEMALSEAREKRMMGTGEYRLVLIDSNKHMLFGLKEYFRTHLRKYAERKINELRDYFKDNQKLVSNRDIIDYFIERGLDIAHYSSSIEEVVAIPVVFEAVVEDLNVKGALFKKLVSMQFQRPFILTNTSSLPISLLNKHADLKGRIIGFHLYNPPAVQKLLEIIPLENGGDPDLYALALDIGDRLGKKIVISKDIAGFIGNGHFVREIAQAVKIVKELARSYSFLESIYMVNRITGDFLLRPMGIFQLIDYVGLDVMHKVGSIMNESLKRPIYDDHLFKPLIEAEHKGGQFPDGSQKEGFFSYHEHIIEGIYDSDTKSYRSLSENQFQHKCDQFLGDLPEEYLSWAVLNRDPDRQLKIDRYLKQLEESTDMGSRLASEFLQMSGQIAVELVEEHVAASKEDVKTVLKNGFYHLYANF